MDATPYETDLGAPLEQRRPVIIRTPRKANVLFADGFVVGLDGDPNADAAMPEEARNAPWWAIEEFDDLDRLIGAVVSRETHLRNAIAVLSAEAASHAARREALLRKFEHLVPRPAEGKKYKDTRGVSSMANYRCQPEREPALVVKGIRDVASELDALGLVNWSPGLSVTACRKYIEANGGELPPHVEAVPQPAVSFTMPKAAPDMAQGITLLEVEDSYTPGMAPEKAAAA